MLVIDASAMVDLLLVRPCPVEIERYIVDHGADLHAPHLHAEVASALRRLVNTAKAPADRGIDAIDDLLAFSIERYPHAALLPRIWELREHVSAYDATYVALAEAMTEPSSPRSTPPTVARA
jgi:predicted nucleic acid-binding protein